MVEAVDVRASCLTCRYFVRSDDGKTGQCRRHPRTADTVWPVNDATDWCGEWVAGNAQQLSAAQAATIYPPIMFSASNDPLPCVCGATANVFNGERSRMSSAVWCESRECGHPHVSAGTLALATIMWNAMPRPTGFPATAPPRGGR